MQYKMATHKMFLIHLELANYQDGYNVVCYNLLRERKKLTLNLSA